MLEVENNSRVSGAHINYIEKLKDALLSFLRDEDIKVVLFGSRARGDSVNTSDVDIGIMPGEGADRKKLILLREYIDKLNIPYKVEIVDFSCEIGRAHV